MYPKWEFQRQPDRLLLVESHQANEQAASDRVATGIKLALDNANIDMPYPHTVVIFDKGAPTDGQDGAFTQRLEPRDGVRGR